MRLALIFIFISLSVQGISQAAYYLPGQRGAEIVDRWDILYWDRLPQRQLTSVANITRKHAYEWALAMKGLDIGITENEDAQFLLDDNAEYDFTTNEEGKGESYVRKYDSTGIFYETEIVENP